MVPQRAALHRIHDAAGPQVTNKPIERHRGAAGACLPAPVGGKCRTVAGALPPKPQQVPAGQWRRRPPRRAALNYKIQGALTQSLMITAAAAAAPTPCRLIWLRGPPITRQVPDSMLLAAVPMALATIVDGINLLLPGVTSSSDAARSAATALWWLVAALSVVASCAVPYFMFTAQHHCVQNMSVMWIVPGLPGVVVRAASGGLGPYALHVRMFAAQHSFASLLPEGL